MCRCRRRVLRSRITCPFRVLLRSRVAAALPRPINGCSGGVGGLPLIPALCACVAAVAVACFSLPRCPFVCLLHVFALLPASAPNLLPATGAGLAPCIGHGPCYGLPAALL